MVAMPGRCGNSMCDNPRPVTADYCSECQKEGFGGVFDDYKMNSPNDNPLFPDLDYNDVGLSNGRPPNDIIIGVDVPDNVSDEQEWMYVQLASIYQESLQTVIDKDQDYGSSYLNTRDESPFDDELQEQLYNLAVRCEDKTSRFFIQALGDGQNCVDEDTDETTVDAAGYWMLMTWVLRYGAEGGSGMEDE